MVLHRPVEPAAVTGNVEGTNAEGEGDELPLELSRVLRSILMPLASWLAALRTSLWLMPLRVAHISRIRSGQPTIARRGGTGWGIRLATI